MNRYIDHRFFGSACKSGKRFAFFSIEDAWEFLSRKRGPRFRACSAYYCPDCGLYHITASQTQ
jgi:hypothetical protein